MSLNKRKKWVNVGNYRYTKSWRKNKKLYVDLGKGSKGIHFGHKDYQHYKDVTGIWSSLDHMDEERRRRYLDRARGIRNGEGSLTWIDPNYANYHSINILW